MRKIPTLITLSKPSTLLIMWVCFFPNSLLAQSSLISNVIEDYNFSYSVMEVGHNNSEVLEQARQIVLSAAAEHKALHYATWSSVEKPVDAPFAGLLSNQMGLMVAWPKETTVSIEVLDDVLGSLDSVSMVSNRLFEAIYLPAGLNVPTKTGFYVHREEEYLVENVDEAVRLSKEAWVTWEPYWKVRVIGLFRELGLTDGYENLNRIVWYPSFDDWSRTRNFAEDKESASRFRQRRTLLKQGSGLAIATNREVDE
ncbi:MAG: hypothetical protein AB8B95_05025 [Pseudohongiellaceae bacterium]